MLNQSPTHALSHTLPSSSAHQTPVKRAKLQEEPLTAESDLPAPRFLSQLDACQLFEKFEQLVRVSVEEEGLGEQGEEEVEEVARCLDYDSPRSLRLHFTPATSSMKKKPIPAPLKEPFTAINLFPVASEPQPQPQQLPLTEESFHSPKRVQAKAWVGASWATHKKREL